MIGTDKIPNLGDVRLEAIREALIATGVDIHRVAVSKVKYNPKTRYVTGLKRAVHPEEADRGIRDPARGDFRTFRATYKLSKPAARLLEFKLGVLAA